MSSAPVPARRTAAAVPVLCDPGDEPAPILDPAPEPVPEPEPPPPLNEVIR